MATSGSKDFSLTVKELYQSARRLIPGKPRSNRDEDENNREALNMLIKHWQGMEIGVWMLRDVYIFLSDGGYEYDLGSSGKLAYSMLKTELSADAASGATSFTVDSITDISDGDYLGVELDDGTLQWTTVSGTPSSLTITPATALSGAASTDNHVYTFTDLADRPIALHTVRLVDPDGNEVELNQISTVDYDRLTDKDSEGNPSQYVYDKQLTNGILKIWPAAEDVQYYIKAKAVIEIDDFDSNTDDLEVPKQFYRAIKFNLAADMYHEYSPDKTPAEVWVTTQTDINRKAEKYFNEIAGFDSDDASLIFDYK